MEQRHGRPVQWSQPVLLPSSVAQLPAASPSADTAQQTTRFPPNASAACQHRSATARLEHTQQRNRLQLPHPYPLSAPSSHRARTALASASKHNSCQVSPVIARHQQLSRTLCRHGRGCQLHRSCRRHDWQPGDSRASRGRNCDWSSLHGSRNTTPSQTRSSASAYQPTGESTQQRISEREHRPA